MKFKFSYQKLLEFYKTQEEVARRDYVDVAAKLENEKAKYQHTWDLHDDSLAEIFNLQERPLGAPAGKLAHLDQFVNGQKIRIERQRQVVINHTSIVEQKQEVLLQAVREKKTIEKLKEKKWLEHKKLLVKRERKANDEVVVTRFKREEG